MVQILYFECTFSIPFTAFFVTLIHHHRLLAENKIKETKLTKKTHRHILHFNFIIIGVNKVHLEWQLLKNLYTVIAKENKSIVVWINISIFNMNQFQCKFKRLGVNEHLLSTIETTHVDSRNCNTKVLSSPTFVARKKTNWRCRSMVRVCLFNTLCNNFANQHLCLHSC